MATHYLPSSGWYSTSNQYIFYRFKIDESISGSTRNISVAVQAYKSSSSTADTTTKGTFYLTINGTAYNGTIAQDTNFYADGTVRTYHTAIPSISASTTSLSVSGYFDVSRFSSDNQGGTISLTSANANQCVYVRYQQADGSWGEYSPVINTTYASGETVSWYKDEDVIYKAASISYTATTSSKTSYVDVYRQTYTINYDANGGLCAPTQTFYYGCDLYLTNNRPTRSGYTFNGWSTSSSASSATYSSGDSYDNNIGDSTLYAVWSKNISQDIYLYSDGSIYAHEYIEGENLSFGNNGEIYASAFLEEFIDNGNFAMGSTFVALNLCEGQS